MNIAFPLPHVNLTSVLRFDHAGDGIALTTRPPCGPIGDEGIYLVTPLLPVRLPIDETILVWRTTGAEAEPRGVVLQARHDMWLFGILYLKLRTAIRRRREGSRAGGDQQQRDAPPQLRNPVN